MKCIPATTVAKKIGISRPSRQNGVHDGFDRRKQAVKMADAFGIEKVWAAIYERSRQHVDFGSKKSNWT